MHNPILLPGFRGSLSKQVYLFQAIAELGSKKDGQRLHRHQKDMSGGEPLLAVVIVLGKKAPVLILAPAL
ncbi:MAG: hypothetical protein WA996_16340 [Candidatus Promineifilaceae bacterium]